MKVLFVHLPKNCFFLWITMLSSNIANAQIRTLNSPPVITTKMGDIDARHKEHLFLARLVIDVSKYIAAKGANPIIARTANKDATTPQMINVAEYLRISNEQQKLASDIQLLGGLHTVMALLHEWSRTRVGCIV